MGFSIVFKENFLSSQIFSTEEQQITVETKGDRKNSSESPLQAHRVSWKAFGLVFFFWGGGLTIRCFFKFFFLKKK